jgi:hypothetical protein
VVVKIVHFKNRSEVNGMLQNVLQEKGGGEQLYRSFEKRRSVTKRVKEEENILQTIKRKAKWIGHILTRNCLLEHFNEGKREEGIDGKTRKNT